jgi:uncharacterized protein YcbK (DUF882 family)
VLATAEEFDAKQIQIISGYRHPKHNLSLVKKGREAARDSQHTRSQAIDFGAARRPDLQDLQAPAQGPRRRRRLLPVSEFVHVDTGKRRTWKGT